jgi:glycosyltransferase involved in cell wall biosynthesis
MRLAIIASLLPADTGGGAEAYVEMAATSLAERHDVTVLTGSHAEVDGVRTIRLPRLPILERGSGASLGRLMWHARDQWMPSVHVILGRALRGEAPDVVWTHEPQGLSAAVFTAVARRKLPHVHTAHDLNLMCARTSMTRNGTYCGGRCFECRIQRQIRGRAIGMRLDRFIGVSRYITKRHVDEGIVAAERALTIRVGADPAPLRLRTASETPTIGFIGAVAQHKGIRTLLRAFTSGDMNRRLLVAGTGPLGPEVEVAARSDTRIEYLGYVDGDAKASFFDRIDLLVVPSEWEEPGPFVAMEAAIRGIPCVVSDRGGLPETPEARTFRAGDDRALREAVAWFLDTPERLTQASRRLAASQPEYAWSTHLARVEGVLKEAADAKQPA